MRSSPKPLHLHVHLVHLPRRPDQTWQSGLENIDNTRKPAFATFTAKARTLDFRSPIVYVKTKTSNPVRVPVWGTPARSRRHSARRHGEDVLQAPQHRRVTADLDIATDSTRLRRTLKSRRRGRLTVSFNINDKNGNRLYRTATIVVP
jgi:hypothetical protein